MKKAIAWFIGFQKWFDTSFGWFFTNGMKVE
jgi:hypothetical protein